jgi:hypothetical protein
MCDYSLENVTTRPAKIAHELKPCSFGTGTRGFGAPEDPTIAVCLLPGAELAFLDEIATAPRNFWSWKRDRYKAAIFRQIHTEMPRVHHDALEFPDGRTVLLTALPIGKRAMVLQLPLRSEIGAQAKAHRRPNYASDSMPS